jgi:photosystem II stability/assembly factor-like uncharacterized protein
LASSDGVEWSPPQFGKEGEVWRAGCVGKGRCVLVGSYGGANILAVTTDGKTWKTRTQDARYSRYFRGVTFGNDTFLAIGGDPGAVGSSQPFVALSADGVEWSELINIAGVHILRRVAFGKGLFVGVGDRGRRAASRDGKVWKDPPSVRAVDTLVDVAFGKDVFVGVGLHGLRMTSTDGITWTDRQTGEEGEHLNSIVWTGEQFVAVGQGATYTSPEGRTWKRTPNHDAPLTVVHGKGVFVGANWRGRLLLSRDGVEWKQVHKCEEHVEMLAFGALS